MSLLVGGVSTTFGWQKILDLQKKKDKKLTILSVDRLKIAWA